jgi:hypothetical protein
LIFAKGLFKSQVCYQSGLAQELAASHQVANCHVKVGVATAPVRDLCERVTHQYLLRLRVYEIDTVLVYGYQQNVRIVRFGCLLKKILKIEFYALHLFFFNKKVVNFFYFNFEECRAERRPLVNDLEEPDLCIVAIQRAVFHKRCTNILFKMRAD